MLYLKHDVNDPELVVFVSIHVDDFRALDNCPSLTHSLRVALIERFEEITEHSPSTSFAGISTRQCSNGAVEVHQSSYIERVSGVVGITHLPVVDAPCGKDIFHRSTAPADRQVVSTLVYASLTGHLIQMLKTRDDVRPYVSTLCSRNASPDVGDYNKALHVLRYLYCTRHKGKVFASDSTDIVAHGDAAFGSNFDGSSQEAYFLSIGPNNAPFCCVARAQTDVATCPMTAEYMTASGASRAVLQYRWLVSALGWPPSRPTVLRIDCATARHLAMAPEITRKSLHIHVKYHYIRQLVVRGDIVLELVRSADMRADVLTKWFPAAVFRRLSDILLNRGALVA